VRTLNLGCGGRPDGRGLIPDGAAVINHDRLYHSPYVNVAHDLNSVPWPWLAGEFEMILAFDVLEHLQDIVAVMAECWRILRADGRLLIHTNNIEYPIQAWRDPTHVRAFEIESFDFFDPTTRWGAEYGRFYTRRFWRVLKRERQASELFFELQKIREEE
jgi:SAM-dependent methyltransferase